jgi:putative heme transporter
VAEGLKDASAAAPPDEQERELADSEPEGTEAGAAGAEAPEPPRLIVPRWVQLVLLPIGLLLLWAIAKAAGKVLLVFVVAAVIALILNPVVALVQRPRIPRGLAVLVVYLAFFLALVGAGFLLANPVSKQVRTFVNDVPHLVKEANRRLADLEGELNDDGLHVHFIKQGKTALQTIQDKAAKSLSKIVSFSGALLTEVVTAGIQLVLVFVLSVYMLVYGERIGSLVRRVMPRGSGEPADDYPTLVQRAVSRYVGGQLLFSLIMGTTAGIALYIFGLIGIFPAGKTYALAFGAFLAVMELIPYIGPILGAVPPIIVALFSEPIQALWVALLFVGIQQFEGHVVAPQIFGHTLRINPLVVIFGLLLGEQLYGFVGVLVALPVLAILRETVLYLRRHLAFEPWERSDRGLL